MRPSHSTIRTIGTRMLGWMAAASLAFAAASLTGCATVAPYERGALAHPTMSPEDILSSGLDEHVRAVSEGATGGFGGGGGGCGCN